MSVDPQTIRAEAHERLGRLVQENAAAIIECWRIRALDEQPHADRTHERALLDHLRELLAAIGRSLQVDEREGSSHVKQAIQHGLQRWNVGWSLPELVRDYQILRLVLLDFLEDSLVRPLHSREVMAIGLALDEAISASVITYVNNRDEHLRELEQDRVQHEKRIQEQVEESLRRQAERLKEADRRKNEFLALLGHELRNPLGAMSNALELTKILDIGDPDHRGAQQIVERQLHQMERLVDDLLDISRITRGSFELRREMLSWNAVMQQAVSAVRPLIDAHGHKLEVRLLESEVAFYGDPARLQQVLSNLLINAAKYTPRGGRIALSAECDGGQILVRVRDSGIGISAEMLPRVFDMFTQVDGARVHSEGGLGLGLALAQSLVRLHGGTIEAFSDGPGQGSEFVVRLPRSEPASPAEPASGPDERSPAPPEQLAPRQLKVLVVDDNRDVAQTLAALLKHSGHQVELAHDGPAAIAQAANCRPDLALVDIGLPGMDGYQVAREMRGRSELQGVILAAMTGYGQEEHRRQSEAAGFDHHLVKPLQLTTLLALLAKLPVGER
ncbi:MAG TPA: ATP-binding protein [Pirellulales bacterium]|nr:ATP-binding protein [Pirellulales bacterium]